MDSDSRVYRFKIFGRVQGVGFRYFTKKNADQLGLCGWVRNQADGSVTVHALLNVSQRERFLEILHKGPALSKVTKIEESLLDSADLDSSQGFRVVRRSSLI